MAVTHSTEDLKWLFRVLGLAPDGSDPARGEITPARQALHEQAFLNGTYVVRTSTYPLHAETYRTFGYALGYAARYPHGPAGQDEAGGYTHRYPIVVVDGVRWYYDTLLHAPVRIDEPRLLGMMTSLAEDEGEKT